MGKQGKREMRLLLLVLVFSFDFVTSFGICDCNNCCACNGNAAVQHVVPQSFALICPTQCGTQCTPQIPCPCGDSSKTTEPSTQITTTTIEPTTIPSTTTIVPTTIKVEESTTKKGCETTPECSCNGGNVPDCPCRETCKNGGDCRHSCNEGGDCQDSCRNGGDCKCNCEKEDDCHCSCNSKVNVVVKTEQAPPHSSSSSLYAFISSILCISITRLL
uniref:Uncharacterized protein n=1 Tax=Pristionchus pacificus TaxID=54126 RepID=A0A8R1YF81_PRIPA